MPLFFPASKDRTLIPSSEWRVRQCLEVLSDEWRVFHSVKWQSLRQGRQGDGEADFLLVHREHGILVLEVKGGLVEVSAGQWFSTDRYGTRNRIKNPFDQARDSKYALLAYLRALAPSMSHVPINYAVVFPNILQNEHIGPYGPRQIIWDTSNLADIPRSLEATLTHWGAACRLSQLDVEQITSQLAPTVSVRLRLKEHLVDTRDVLLQLTERQIWAFARLRASRSALVTGAAGTGKTVLAMERARRLASDGFRTLLTCFNQLLAEHLRSEVEPISNIYVSTFHALCVKEASRSKIPIPSNPSDEWWDSTAPSILVDSASKNQTCFDALVIDEGQDFAQSWIDCLRTLLRQTSDGPLYVFSDHHQQLYRRVWHPPADWPVLELDMNCRNAGPIAARVAAVFGDALTGPSPPGPEPIFLNVDLQRDGVPFIQRLVARLLTDEGLSPEQISVLADDPGLIRELHYTMAGEHPFTSRGKTGVVAETVARFKGLESDVVILALSDTVFSAENRWQPISYVGMSRARGALFVLGSRRARTTLAWDSGKRT